MAGRRIGVASPPPQPSPIKGEGVQINPPP